MPVLEDTRHERYCQLRAEGKLRKIAYKLAGFTAKTDASAQNGGNKLEQMEEIKLRIKELQEEGAKIAEVNRAKVLLMLMEDRELARKAHQAAAAIRASELLGKEVGMFVDRKEIKTGFLDDTSFGLLDELRQALETARARPVIEINPIRAPAKKTVVVLSDLGKTAA